jgi:hypothetical protein
VIVHHGILISQVYITSVLKVFDFHLLLKRCPHILVENLEYVQAVCVYIYIYMCVCVCARARVRVCVN